MTKPEIIERRRRDSVVERARVGYVEKGVGDVDEEEEED